MYLKFMNRVLEKLFSTKPARKCAEHFWREGFLKTGIFNTQRVVGQSMAFCGHATTWSL